jgi:signal transduction histidine kinase
MRHLAAPVSEPIRKMKFYRTFRGRLVIVLALLLMAMLGVQYILNLRSQQENNALREQQQKALVAGITLGFNGLQSTDRLADFLEGEGRPFFDRKVRERILDIIIINPDWEVDDSLNPELLPTGDRDRRKYMKLSELTWLPPIKEGSRLGEDLKRFPQPGVDGIVIDGEAHAIPIETNQGRFYVMVVLKNDKQAAAERAARPLIYTLAVLLASFAITFFLVWRFARPISELSDAAARVAGGDFDVHIGTAGRTDEMGELARRFNEMTSELGRKQDLEAKLQEAERSAVIGRLGASVAHEIRNPLNYITLSLDHLKASFPPEGEERKAEFDKMMAQLKVEVGRIEERVSELLDFARPRKPDFMPVDILEVIQDSLKIVRARATDSGIVLEMRGTDRMPEILADGEYLRSLFSNLFINAVKAMEPNGRGLLRIETTATENELRVVVSDDGPGIAEEDLPRIFEPYFSVAKTGTGLGLAIAQRVVEIHRGRIAVESHPNEGARFIVILPLNPESRQDAQGAKA